MSSYAYNPFTSNLDIAGSESYIDGVVATPASLPVTLNTPPLDAVYLAKAGSGVWLINRRPAGLYCRTANNGNAADWTYLGAFPEVNADGNWELYNSTDPTKELKFDLSGLPTATVRTVNAPDGNGKMLVEGQSIGATTRNTIAATTLSANNGTITASAPVLDLAQTWNNAAVEFHLCTLGIGNSTPWTASTAASTLFRIRVASSTVFSVGYTGTCNAAGLNIANGSATINGNIQLSSNVTFNAGTTTGFCDITSSVGCGLRLYNTGNASAANYERGFMRWTASALQIGTEAGGTGSNRNLELRVGAATYTFSTVSSIASSGSFVAASSSAYFWQNRGRMYTTADGVFVFANNGDTDFGRLCFGGTTSSFPALKRSSTTLQVRLADDSADAPFSSGAITTSGHFSPSATNSFDIGTSSVRFRWGYFFTGIALGATSTGISSGSDGVIQLRNNNGADFGRLQFGGTTSSFPALKRSTTTIQVRLADDTGDAGLSCSTLTLSDNLTFGSGDNIVLSTTTGTQIGTATNQLLGFYGATPVTQRAAIADATDAATTQARLNDLLAAMRSLGLIAT